MTTTPAVTTVEKPAYYLAESNGGIEPFGGVKFLGSEAPRHLRVKFIGGAEVPDAGGYWIATTSGNVYRFGDARFLGSPVHRANRKPIVAIAASPTGEGYWLVASNGAVYNYGDAAYCGSLVHTRLASPIVAFAPSPSDDGYWLVAANGTVYAYGNAPDLGSVPTTPGAAPGNAVAGIAPTADGRGYWIAAANGTVYRFGDATSLGSPAALRLTVPFVSIVSTADGGGYWLTTANGRIFGYGDAHFAGSLAHSPPPSGVTVTGLMRSYTLRRGIVSLPHHDFGYDISSFQCKTPTSNETRSGLPPSSPVSVLQVTGWLDGADNPCLAAEATWATQAAGSPGSPYSLYLFVNAPDTTPAGREMAATGPKGNCATLTGEAVPLCRAYNYGYNGANAGLAYAASQGVHSSLWWLDIENDGLSPSDYSDFAAGHYWAKSSTLNDATIQGALDALRGAGLQVGLYSTSLQYPIIAGSYVPTGPQLPLWIAGVPRTKPPYAQSGLSSPSVLPLWCTGTARYANPGSPPNELFAGGVPELLQETPGALASPYGVDPDYSC